MIQRAFHTCREALLCVLLTTVFMGSVVQGQREDRTSQNKRRFTYGDITLTGFSRLQGNFVSTITAEGPHTTVNAFDPKTGARTRMSAQQIVVTMDKKNRSVVKIEASGNVKIDGERPIPGQKGVRIFSGSGNKGTYFRAENRLSMEGPLQFYVEQPPTNGTGKQWVRGSAKEGSYDDNKRLLTLSGAVRAKVFDPETMPENQPADIMGDELTLDFSTTPVTFTLRNYEPERGEVRIRMKERQSPKGKEEK
jgi:lipopolysaccharide export system protein LptA